MRKIYLASSWRNAWFEYVLKILREAGHEVYNFKHPNSNDNGFHWGEIDIDYRDWCAETFVAALEHPVSHRGFNNDWKAMEWADTCVLLLPSGRSAHLEAGYFVGARKSLHILLMDYDGPDLMWKMADKIHLNTVSLEEALAS